MPPDTPPDTLKNAKDGWLCFSAPRPELGFESTSELRPALDSEEIPAGAPANLGAVTPKLLQLFIRQPWLKGQIQSQTVQTFNRLDLAQPAVTPLLLKAGASGEPALPILIDASYHQGRVIIGNLSDLASNEYLATPNLENYQVFTNLVTAPGNPIYINEYIHGHGTEENIFIYLGKHTPLGKIFIQLVFSFLLLLWWSFISWRPRRQLLLKEDKNIDLEEFIQSLAGIYYKANASPLILEIYLKRIEQTLQHRHGLSLEAPAVRQNEINTERLRQCVLQYLDNFHGTDNLDTLPISAHLQPLTAEQVMWAIQQAQEMVQKRSRKLPSDQVLKIVQVLSRLTQILQTRSGVSAQPLLK